jgi:3-methyladenine DNA glycosylase AlkD
MNAVRIETTPITAATIQRELESQSDKGDAIFLQGYFKTGPGEYGAGDRFRGVRVPVLRRLSRKHAAISLPQTTRLLKSRFHEDRSLALMILTRQFERADAEGKATIYDLYLANTRHINNWDLVDCSAAKIVGAFLDEQSRAPIHQMAKSSSIWERRIAIMATGWFIRKGEFPDTLEIAKTLLGDREDLIHKAVGWMLREVGNRDRATEEKFLRANYRQMPRTMLRYAIEKFPEGKRQRYLKGIA